MNMAADLAASLGRRIRRARYASRRSQREVADGATVSQSTVSRIELGNGGAFPLDTWARVAAAVGLDLGTVIHTPFQESALGVQIRCHRLVVERAATGGWLGWTLSDSHDPAETTTILDRSGLGEVAVVRVWDVIANVEHAFDRLEARIDRERHERGPGHRVGGAFVVTPTGPNRRRFAESAVLIKARLMGWDDAWLAAIGKVHVPMPDGIGMIWTDSGLTRLRPYVPYVDCRARHAARA